ncbi:MAG: hypothetical protein ACJA01_004437 [Saprospiraceae bacterium]|jgi:hypothetical protein
MMDLIVKLLIAHVIGDFVLQPNSWVEEERKGTKRLNPNISTYMA